MALSRKDLELIQEVTKRNDRDSFSSFSSGLRENWQIIAFIGGAIWLLSQFANNITARVDTVELNTNRNTELVGEVADTLDEVYKTLSARIDQSENNNAEVLRLLGLLQKDVEIIKGRQ